MTVRCRHVLTVLLGVTVAPVLAACGLVPPPAQQQQPQPPPAARRVLLPIPKPPPPAQASPPPAARSPAVAGQPVLETPLAEPEGPFVLDPRLSRAIRFFGGRVVHPNGFAATVPGLQAYLRASGVRHFSAEELVTPYHPEIAARFGIDLLLPPRRWWQRGAALALIGEDLRRLIDEPIRVRNWWRPPGYNAAVGGDPRGDHPTAHGVDFDYNSPIYRYRAEQRLLQLYTGEPWLELSLGLGPMTAHVGLLSPRGCRLWLYPGHPEHSGRAWRLEETSYHCRGDQGANRQ